MNPIVRDKRQADRGISADVCHGLSPEKAAGSARSLLCAGPHAPAVMAGSDRVTAVSAMRDPDIQNPDLVLPSTPEERQDFVIDRVERQFHHFNAHARAQRALYFTAKVVQIVLAAAVPVAASVHAPVSLTGSLGASIVVLEGVQQLCQWHANWIRYRSTAESLRRELFTCRARVGGYATASDPIALLASRMNEIATSEVAGWSTTFKAEPSKA